MSILHKIAFLSIAFGNAFLYFVENHVYSMVTVFFVGATALTFFRRA